MNGAALNGIYRKGEGGAAGSFTPAATHGRQADERTNEAHCRQGQARCCAAGGETSTGGAAGALPMMSAPVDGNAADTVGCGSSVSGGEM